MKSHLSSDIYIRIGDHTAKSFFDHFPLDFPDIAYGDAPAPQNKAFKIYTAFRPPQDEDIAKYNWIHCTGAGVDPIVSALKNVENPPIITRTIGRMGQQIAEYCLAYSLYHLQKISLRQQLQTDHAWQRKTALAEYLFHQKIAIFGTGEIGRQIAEVFKNLGCNVIGFSNSGRPNPAFNEIHRFANFSAKEHNFDIIINALPLTNDTRNIMDTVFFKGLQQALFINIGRGVTVNLDDLKQALTDGYIRHAVLDVFPEEPLPQNHWCWTHAAVTVTPHISGLTIYKDSYDDFTPHFMRFLETGDLPVTMVDLKRGY